MPFILQLILVFLHLFIYARAYNALNFIFHWV